MELIIKLMGLGVLNYLRDSYNIYDTIIIIFSTIEIALNYSDNLENDSNKPIRRVLIIVRPFRLLRIFKIARRWNSFNFVLQKMTNSLKEVGNFLVLFFIFMFIYALLGMELYSGQVKFDEKNDPLNC
jgi:hypothetical protein